jgi:hypothetical protein
VRAWSRFPYPPSGSEPPSVAAGPLFIRNASTEARRLGHKIHGPMAKTTLISIGRGSKKRLKRLTLRGNWPRPLELVLALLAVGLFGLAVWWARIVSP